MPYPDFYLVHFSHTTSTTHTVSPVWVIKSNVWYFLCASFFPRGLAQNTPAFSFSFFFFKSSQTKDCLIRRERWLFFIPPPPIQSWKVLKDRTTHPPPPSVSSGSSTCRDRSTLQNTVYYTLFYISIHPLFWYSSQLFFFFLFFNNIKLKWTCMGLYVLGLYVLVQPSHVIGWMALTCVQMSRDRIIHFFLKDPRVCQRMYVVWGLPGTGVSGFTKLI